MKQVRFMQEEIDKLPTLTERDDALEKLRRENKEYKDLVAIKYDERVAMIEASPVSQALKDRELAKTENTLSESLKKAAEVFDRELKRIESHPMKAFCKYRRLSVKIPSKCRCEMRQCTLSWAKDLEKIWEERLPT